MRECKGFGNRLDLEGDGRLGPWEKGVVETHREMVCSRCCVERGTEGEVLCLGCLRMVEGG